MRTRGLSSGIVLMVAAACTPAPVGTAGVGSVSRTGLAVRDTSAVSDPRLTKVVALAGPGAPTLLIVRAPAEAVHSFEAGEDTQRHTIAAQGARVTFEYWIRQPTYACQTEACGRTVVNIDGLPATFVQLPGGRSFVAFVPRRGDQGGRGVSIVGTCGSVQGCSLARAIALTLRSV